MSRLSQTATLELHGNHDPCPACEMRRDAEDKAEILRPDIPCNVCKGSGFLPLGDAEICRCTVAEARLIYWPTRPQLKDACT